MSTLTRSPDLIEGDWYFIQGSIDTVAARYIQTKDYEHPTFEVPMMHGTPYHISIARSAVLGRLEMIPLADG